MRRARPAAATAPATWRVFRDLGENGKFVERYVVGSWAEYIRLRSRMTLADRRIQERVFSLQRPGIDIRVSRLIGVDEHSDPAQHVARPRQERKSADTFLRPETEHPDPDQVHPPPKVAAVPVAGSAAASEPASPDRVAATEATAAEATAGKAVQPGAADGSSAVAEEAQAQGAPAEGEEAKAHGPAPGPAASGPTDDGDRGGGPRDGPKP